LSALVRFEVIVNVASAFSTSEGIASLRNKALALAPIESTSDISTLTSVVALIAADDLLGWELNWLLHLLADTISNSRHGDGGVSWRAISLKCHILYALGVLLSPIKLLGEDLIGVLLASLARRHVGSVWKRISEKSFHIS